jgi:hypothetical protein
MIGQQGHEGVNNAAGAAMVRRPARDLGRAEHDRGPHASVRSATSRVEHKKST